MEEIDSALISVKPGGSFAPVAKVVNEAVNKAVVNLGSALTSDLDVKSFLDGKTYAKIVTGGATVIEVKGSKADAEGKTSSLVDVNLVKTGSDKVSINVDNYGKDEVTSLVEKGGGGLIAGVSTSVKVDGEWHEYTLDLSGHPGWTGLVEEVWFDPTELHFTDVLIDSMAFIPTNSL